MIDRTRRAGGRLARARARLVVSLALACLPCAAGCAGEAPKTGYERFMPSAEIARQALEKALSAWQNGRPAGVQAAEPVPVVGVDAEWARGERLQHFKVLGESAGDGPRCFVVRLKLESQRAETNARFVVFGQDPMWVFRHEELDMMAHMEHPASPPAEPPAAK